jgi:hypothetical protein
MVKLIYNSKRSSPAAANKREGGIPFIIFAMDKKIQIAKIPLKQLIKLTK